MTFVKWFLIIVTALLLILVIAGFMMPTKLTLDRTISINAPKTTIYHTMNDFKQFNRWSPWHDIDPNTKYTYSEPASGEGASMKWESDHKDVGNGTQRIVKTTGTDLIELELEFDGFDGVNNAWYALKENGDSTNVTWGYSADLSEPYLVRFFAPVIRSSLERMYDDGLANLKKVIEADLQNTPALASRPNTAQMPSISITHVEAMTVAYAEGQSTFDSGDIAVNLGKGFQAVIGFLNTTGLQMAGQPMAIDTDRTIKGEQYVFEAAIPVAMDTSTTLSASNVKVKQTYSGPAIKAVHVGSYTTLPKTYRAIERYIKQNNLVTAANSWEHYISDPGSVAEDELETQIFFPITR